MHVVPYTDKNFFEYRHLRQLTLKPALTADKWEMSSKVPRSRDFNVKGVEATSIGQVRQPVSNQDQSLFGDQDSGCYYRGSSIMNINN